jgi:cell division protein FtsB
MSKRRSKKDKKNKEKIKFSLENPIILLVFTALAIISIISMRKSNEKAVISKRNIEELEENVEKLQDEVNTEKIELEDSQNEIYKEKIIRNELLQKKEGEIILQIPDLNEEELNEEITDKKPLEQWKELIF